MVPQFKSVRFMGDFSYVEPLYKDGAIVIYDRALRRNPVFCEWLGKFSHIYGVRAGESLKDIKNFPRHFEKLAKLCHGTPRRIKVIAVGGGSVTDFAGFFASVFKRGVPLVLIPSTWLAALDSAHGGKTALNSAKTKNSLGTFYFAEKIFIVKSLLRAQPQTRQAEAFGELFKMALVSGKKWSKDLMGASNLENIDFWSFLRPAIRAKYEIIKRDPFESKGIREVLNLGHTLGHVLEKKNGLAHGIAVGHGIMFASTWSARRRLLSQSANDKIIGLLQNAQGKRVISGLKGSEILSGLRGDKKMNQNDRIQFVFLKGPGRLLTELVPVQEVVREAIRQGWVS